MNAGGHIAVASRALASREAAETGAGAGTETAEVTDRPGYLLGSALPDLGSIGGYRLLGASPDPSVTAGIDLHHRTDDAFHRHPWFADRNRSLADRLQADGVGRGAARACSHVGIELLLDGELLADPLLVAATDDAYGGIPDRLDALDGLVDEQHRSGWREHLRRVAAWRMPDDYDQPDAVARRLHRILARRPRLALADDRVGTVAEALAAVQPGIRATAPEFLAELTELVRSH
ncbi:MAG: hypothetical protein AAGD35_16730 [Actinomycetota bacterium]